MDRVAKVALGAALLVSVALVLFVLTQQRTATGIPAPISLLDSNITTNGVGEIHTAPLFRESFATIFAPDPTAKAVTKVGANAMVEQLALRFGFFMYARLVADLGTQAYASHTVCMQFLNISFTFADGIGVASTSLVGQMLGKERPDLAHIYGKIAQRIALVGGILLASMIVLFRYPLVSLFTDDPTVSRLSANVMLIVALFQPLQMLSVITSGALRGAGDTRYVARVMLICVAIIRPVLAFSAIRLITSFFTPIYTPLTVASAAETLGYWLSFEVPQWALLGAWSASLIDMAIRMGLSMKRFNSGVWHTIKV